MIRYNGYVIGKGGFWLKEPKAPLPPAFPGMTSWSGSYTIAEWSPSTPWGVTFRKIVPSRDVRLVSWSTVESGGTGDPGQTGFPLASAIFNSELPNMHNGSDPPYNIPTHVHDYVYAEADEVIPTFLGTGLIIEGRPTYMYTNNCDIQLEANTEYWISLSRFHDSVAFTGAYYPGVPATGEMEYMWLSLARGLVPDETVSSNTPTTVNILGARPVLILADADGNVVYS